MIELKTSNFKARVLDLVIEYWPTLLLLLAALFFWLLSWRAPGSGMLSMLVLPWPERPLITDHDEEDLLTASRRRRALRREQHPLLLLRAQRAHRRDVALWKQQLRAALANPFLRHFLIIAASVLAALALVAAL